MTQQPAQTDRPLPDFARGIAACLAFGHQDVNAAAIRTLVARVIHRDEVPSTRAELQALQGEVQSMLGTLPDRVGLIYAGPTKIKQYVFEAPKLPEIRGASALLDQVTNEGVPGLWKQRFGSDLAEHTCVFAGGGALLAFAPADHAAELAAEIERLFARETLTANSVAVAHVFSLVELRYGRSPAAFWTEDFLAAFDLEAAEPDAELVALRRELLAYYYPPPDLAARSREDAETQSRKAPDVLVTPSRTPPHDPYSDDALAQFVNGSPSPGQPQGVREAVEAILTARFLHRKTFGECVTLLATAYNRRRNERLGHQWLSDAPQAIGMPRDPVIFALNPWAARCDSSDVRPALLREAFSDGDRDLSEASARKRRVGQLVKGNAGDDWLGRMFPDRPLEGDFRSNSWEQKWQTFLETHQQTPYAQAAARQRKVQPAHDVHEIGAASKGYIGLIYADGNNVGRLMATIQGLRAYAETSRALSDAAERAVFSALARHLEPQNGIHPFEILTIGGDDLMLIVPGNRALDIALTIGQEFERALASQRRQPADQQPLRGFSATSRYAGSDHQDLGDYIPQIGLSAGVVIAQENAPIFFLDRLVGELLKNAKKLARTTAERPGSEHDLGGAIDFMVLKSITMVSDNIGAFRSAALGDRARDPDSDEPKERTSKPDAAAIRRTTARPYTWHEFAGLLATARAINAARIPRSQLYRIQAVLRETPGTMAGSLEYLYTRARRRQYGPTLHEVIEQHWRARLQPGRPFRLPLPPWLPLGRDGWETIWPDLVEIAEMVPEQPVPQLPQEAADAAG